MLDTGHEVAGETNGVFEISMLCGGHPFFSFVFGARQLSAREDMFTVYLVLCALAGKTGNRATTICW